MNRSFAAGTVQAPSWGQSQLPRACTICPWPGRGLLFGNTEWAWASAKRRLPAIIPFAAGRQRQSKSAEVLGRDTSRARSIHRQKYIPIYLTEWYMGISVLKSLSKHKENSLKSHKSEVYKLLKSCILAVII